MNRRRFIVMTAGGAALVGAGAAGGLWLFCADGTVVAAGAQLDDIARSMNGAASTGRAWAGQHPDADPRAELLSSLGLAAGGRIEAERLGERIAARVEADFTEDKLFEHEGWLLSDTEARLAALHVALLGPDASEAREPRFDEAAESRLVRLQDYNPKRVNQGEPLTHGNLPDNVIWFATADPPPPRFRLYIAGTSLTISARDNGFSVRVPDTLRYRLFETPGEFPIWLYDPVVDRRQRLGTLTVLAAEGEGEARFCAVDAWGPKQTRAGQAFNEQPDGASAFWLLIDCFPDTTVVTLDGVRVPTTLRPTDGLITTHIENTALYAEPGEYAVALLDTASGETRPVGTFLVQP